MTPEIFCKAWGRLLYDASTKDEVFVSEFRRRYGSDPSLGRTEDYQDFKIIDPGLTITKMESWTRGAFGIVRLTASNGMQG